MKKVKKLLIALVVLASSPLFAQSDATIDFEILGGIYATNGSYDSLTLDINIQTTTIQVNGSIHTPQGLSAPATGTCFITTQGGAYCNLQVDHLSFNITLNSQLSGTISMKGATGDVIDEAPIYPI